MQIYAELMDLPLPQEESQQGLSSWHPAMKPNAHDQEYDEEDPAVKVPQPNIPSEDTVERLSVEHPLYIQTNTNEHFEPLTSPARPFLQDTARNSENHTHPFKGDASSPIFQNHRDAPQETQYEERAGSVTDLSATQAEPAQPSQVSTDVADAVERDVQQGQASTSVEKGQCNNPSIAKAENPEFCLGDQAEMNRVWERERGESFANEPTDIHPTNSFPVVPPTKQNEYPLTHPLPHSQAEDIMEEDQTMDSLNLGEHIRAAIEEDVATGAVQSHSDFDARLREQSFLAASHDAQNSMPSLEGEEDLRFEEGLPLMPTYQRGLANASQQEDFGGNGDSLDLVDEEIDFFDQQSFGASYDETSIKPHPLDRKSTDQVLNSVYYTSCAATDREPVSGDEKLKSASITTGGIAASTDTINPQPWAEQKVDLSGQTSGDEGLAELWKAALGDDDLLEEVDEPVDPAAFFEGDGEGFLEGPQRSVDNDVLQTEATSIPAALNSSEDTIQWYRASGTSQRAPQNQYLPATASQSPLSHQQKYQSFIPNYSTPTTRAPIGAMGQVSLVLQGRSRPALPVSTQSFADKSKGGYTSPYDLPMDVSRPKKRTTHQQTNFSPDVQPILHRPPPPRSSSMFTGAPPPIESQSSMSCMPDISSSSSRVVNVNPSSLKYSPNNGSFFEELPSTKSRPSSSLGRFPPSVTQPALPRTVSPLKVASRQSQLPPLPNVERTSSSQQYQLLLPERMSLYGKTTHMDSSVQTVPAITSRYSPAPPQPLYVRPQRSRYTASLSATARPPTSQVSPFQPRTSSPLAQNPAVPQQSNQGHASGTALPRPRSNGVQDFNSLDREAPSFPFPAYQELQINDPSANDNDGSTKLLKVKQSSPQQIIAQHPGPTGTGFDSTSALVNSEPALQPSDGMISYLQRRESPAHSPEIMAHGPPKRSQTQSPGAARYVPEAMTAQALYQRPASVSPQNALPNIKNILSQGNQVGHRGKPNSKTLNFVTPMDGREFDDLERWKGCPIFSFGFGGAIVTSFPRQIPRYASVQAAPMIKCSPGEVILRDGKILPIEEGYASFPGPLKSKNKKKDVLDWLQKRVNKLENNIGDTTSSLYLLDSHKSQEEKVLLWKIVQVLVEHDGVLDRSPLAEKAIRSILSPDLNQVGSTFAPIQSSNAPFSGIKRRNESHIAADPENPEAMEDLRKILLHGEREKAVWHAVDNRLWAHAMLLTSTLDDNIRKQVSQEFIRQEVKTYGENTQALAALYQVFAGNWEEIVDELVPPSARAGLRMISKTATAESSKDALEGLDRWRETLTLILSNRSLDDGKALVALGQLLAGYGRTEAAHICYIFAKSPGLFGGPDDSQSSVALLGADHLHFPYDYGRDLDGIFLTELYDFACTVLASSSIATISPHLQFFKLYHATILAEHGHKFEAQQYCEVIMNTLNSTTKRSPYYHPLLFEALNGLMERLRQAPRDNSGSWMSKPSIDKMSGSIWAKFNQYVAGDENDASSTGSGAGHDSAAGPFAGLAGGSPTLSRTPSSNDLYNSYGPSVGINSSLPISNPALSRYAPASLYSPKSSLEQQGRPILDVQQPIPNDTFRPTLSQQQYQSKPSSSSSLSYESYKPLQSRSTYPAHTDSYLPTPPVQSQHKPKGLPDQPLSSSYPQRMDDPSLSSEPQSLQGLNDPQPDREPVNGYGYSSESYEISSAYEPQSKEYESVTSNGYAPPSSSPRDLPAEDSPLEKQTKKESYMDDDEDDDFEARAASIRKEEQTRKDRETDEAFRRAAEADGKLLHHQLI